MADADDTLFRNRRFGIAVAFSLAGCGLTVAGKLDGGEFVMLAGAVLALYGGVDALNNRRGRRGNNN